MKRRKVIVIGAGHDGLTAAAVLARAGLEVTVLEAAERLGGRAAELAVGVSQVPGLLHDTSCVSTHVIDLLRLERFGLRLREPPAVQVVGERGAIAIRRGGVDGTTDRDAEAYASLRAFVRRVGSVLKEVLHEPPAAPTGELWPLARLGLSVRRLGRKDMLTLLRLAPMSVGDWMKDELVDPRLRAGLALPAVMGEYLGPWSAGSAAPLLLRWALSGREVVGGPAGLIEALRACAVAQGAEVKTGCEVERIVVERDAVTSVMVAGGEPVPADLVLSTCDPKRTLLGLVGAPHLPDALALAARRLRTRGTAAKVLWQLEKPLALDGAPIERLRTAHDLDAIERSFDAVKYRRSADPPSLDVRTFERDGRHVASILAHGVPQTVDGGWSDERRGRLAEAVKASVARVCPSLRVAHERLLTPDDLEREHRLTGGQLHHLELAPDQLLFMRPAVDCAQYATPLKGLFLGGAGSHPGGPLTCISGWLAAQAISSAR